MVGYSAVAHPRMRLVLHALRQHPRALQTLKPTQKHPKNPEPRNPEPLKHPKPLNG